MKDNILTVQNQPDDKLDSVTMLSGDMLTATKFQQITEMLLTLNIKAEFADNFVEIKRKLKAFKLGVFQPSPPTGFDQGQQ